MVDREQICGVARVTRNNEVAFEVSGGVADERAGLMCAADVRFQLASVSKQFTAASILLLADDNKLKLDTPVTQWLQDCPESWRAITLHHLLSHTSGLPHWWGVKPGWLPDTPMAPQDELRLFQEAQLLDEPGQSWHYSSVGYVLLAHVVQLVADQPYGSYLHERFFDPLGMTSTFAGAPHGREQLAVGHKEGDVVPSFDLDGTHMGAGDVWSTVGDVTTWDTAVTTNSILSEESRRAMLRIQAPIPPGIADNSDPLADEGYGYGWIVGRRHGRRVLYHAGDNPGFVALNAWFPDDDLFVVVLSNEETTELSAWLNELLLHVAE